MDKHQTKKLRFLFNAAFAVEKMDRKPFSDVEYICDFQIKNGLDLGENYVKDHVCQKIVLSAASINPDDITEKYCGQEPFC